MINSDNRLFCRLDGLSTLVREQQRLQVMTDLGLLESGSVPVFEEATQTAAHSLDVPICVLGLMEADTQRYKSAVGLSRLGLMNSLAMTRQLPRSESFCTHVVDSQQSLVIPDTLGHPAFANSLLVHQFGLRAYLGVPLMTASGDCVGTLAVMDLSPRRFTENDVEFLAMTARWSMSEFERQSGMAPATDAKTTATLNRSIASQLKVELLGQLTQELRTPLTSVMGMASVLTREIYGPLTHKQKEYLDIIHRSGQYLLSLVNEILELSELNDSAQALQLISVDIEMLCQQAINTLEQAASRREQQIRLSVEPGRRIWLLDKPKVRQMLYHLMFSLIQSSNAGSILRLHVSRRGAMLNIAVWVTHPWLGEGLSASERSVMPSMVSIGAVEADREAYYQAEAEPDPSPSLGGGSRSSELARSREETCNTLGLLLCRQLAEMHQGQFSVLALSDGGHRYVISLPQISEGEE